MTDNFEESLLKATDLELNQRDRYVKSFENEYRVSHPLDALVEATSKDIGNKALVAHISTVAINLTTAGATGTVFYFLELEVVTEHPIMYQWHSAKMYQEYSPTLHHRYSPTMYQ